MVLTRQGGGAGRTGAPRPPCPPVRRRPGLAAGERGSQTLEFALVLPLAVLLLVLGLHAGLLAADLVAAQGLAREAARMAAVADDDTVNAALAAAAGRQPVGLALRPQSPRRPGTFVTAEVRLRSRAFRAFGQEVWLPATATMRTESA
ncbi:MAG: hypothetical protein GEU81_01145 [Nitriliruptorales bacterium]|nr:hypothetical protein [Nitriliruptorales bacterium]